VNQKINFIKLPDGRGIKKQIIDLPKNASIIWNPDSGVIQYDNGRGFKDSKKNIESEHDVLEFMASCGLLKLQPFNEYLVFDNEDKFIGYTGNNTVFEMVSDLGFDYKELDGD
jgi:hypothetical protein